jgi:uncharacterized protein YndB with AHSA1/START domain
MDDGLNLERELFVPADLVFEAWTRPEHLAGWYPGDGERLEATAQPGGFDLLRTADGGVLETIEQIDAEQSHLLRWQVQHDGETLELEVGFAGGGGTCTLSVRQRGFSDTAERDRQVGTWRRRLERLEAYFSVI